jgi:phosphinothricin acetyltransferase
MASTLTQLHISLMRPTDVGEVLDLYEHYVLNSTCTAQTERYTPTQRADWLAVHHPDRYPVMVARAQTGGPVIGWASVSPWSPRQAYARTAEESVYVAASHHGRGVGRAVLSALIEHVPRHTSIRVLVARIVHPNPASESLHRACGFRPVGLMRYCAEKFGQPLDVLLMDRHL